MLDALLAQTPPWLDYLLAFSTAIAAVGTLAAVVLALYLNVWREERRKPQLTFEDYEDTWFGVAFNPGESAKESVWGIPLLVKNAPGRETAHQVQVLASLGFRADPSEDWVDMVVDQPLVWKFAALPSAGDGVATVDIPPGSSRKIFVAFIGEANQLYKSLWPREAMLGGFANEAGEQIEYGEDGEAVSVSPPIAGVLASFPFTQEDAFWIWRDQEYRLRLTLTSRDTDAATYETLITFVYSEHEGRTREMRGAAFIQPTWPDPDWISAPI